jgi:hypothetical protein
MRTREASTLVRFAGMLMLIFFAWNCSPSIKSKKTILREPIGNDAPVVLLSPEDSLTLTGLQQLGTIRIGDKGLSVGCSYNEIEQLVFEQARAMGGNLVKITEHNYPDNWSACHRIKAIVYFKEDIYGLEKRITWNKKRKLTWNDFKDHTNQSGDSTVSAYTYCGFDIETTQVTAFSSPKYRVNAYFDCNSSWFNQQLIGDSNLLNHEQGHFDLSEIFARVLRKDLMNSLFKQPAFDNMQEYLREKQLIYTARQREYDRSTQHGALLRAQQNWTLTIQRELDSLSRYEN